MSRRKQLESLILDTPPHRSYIKRQDRHAIEDWLAAGAPVPPPPGYKRQVVREVAERYGLGVLVETGTFQGDMVGACLRSFDRIYSIELFDENYRRAVRRFKRFPSVTIVQGDSASALARVVETLEQPALFWLDAHYSGDGTARGVEDSPIVHECAAIARRHHPGHAILIDDMRCFNGESGYPTVAACTAMAAELWPVHQITIEHDIMRILPREAR